MAICFLKKIAENKVDDLVHKKFVRYSRGEFEKEELKIKFGSKIQMWAGYEYIDIFFQLAANIVEAEVSIKGIILAKNNIDNDLSGFGIKPSLVKKVKALIKYQISAKLTPDEFRKFVNKFIDNYLLLNLKSEDIEIKTKTALPKPGTLTEKFVSMKLPKKYEAMIRDEFCFNSKDSEVTVKHKYFITEIDIPKQYENDPEKARLEARRKGKLIIDVNGKKSEFKLDV